MGTWQQPLDDLDIARCAAAQVPIDRRRSPDARSVRVEAERRYIAAIDELAEPRPDPTSSRGVTSDRTNRRAPARRAWMTVRS